MAKKDYITQIVLIADLPAYRTRHGLQIVRADWPWRAARPTMLCRPIQQTSTAPQVAAGQDSSSTKAPPLEKQEE